MIKSFRIALMAFTGLLLPACGQPAAPTPPAGSVKAGWTVSDWSEWKQQDTGPEAKVKVVPDLAEKNPGPVRLPMSEEAKKAGVLLLGPGEPFAVVRYQGAQPLLVDEYEITWEAMRVEGNDFFAA